jgi:hypothetical protein
MATETWNIDLTMTQQGDSIHGQANIVSVPARVNNGYTVAGVVDGDSLRLKMLPIEDADVYVDASMAGTRLSGILWLNSFTADAQPVVFARQSGP